VTITLGDTIVGTLVPGGLFGEMALIDDSPRSATAVAAIDCTLAPIDQQQFEFLVQRAPAFAQHIMRVLKDRVIRYDQMMRGVKG
jgi:CRP-like cAMP-binding protein